MEDFEKLGAFYLGRPYDLSAKKQQEGLLLYDSKDLVTHAVCVGMTGSGKTGLCIVLIEEALIDGVPAIVIDPKGDLGNLLLSFPDLAPESFRPWVNEDEARRLGVSAEELAAREAERWKAGLAEWGQNAERIARLRDAAEIALYTPGGTRIRRVAVGRPARRGLAAALLVWHAALRHLFNRASQRQRANVLRIAAPESGVGLGAHPVGHDEPAGTRLHGRDLRILSAGGQSAKQSAAPHAAQASARLRVGCGLGHAESG